MTAKSRKTLFLVDAMGYIFRAYYAPMGDRFEHEGIPTKVPYIFATMMRALSKDKERPDYLGVVFDHRRSPRFATSSSPNTKRSAPPMPDDLSIQLPFVRRYCEAMRLPILEFAGYEADDVIGSLARQASSEETSISSSSPATRT